MLPDEKSVVGPVPHRIPPPRAAQCSKYTKMKLLARSASVLALGSLAAWSLAGPLFASRGPALPTGGHGHHGHCGMSLAEKEAVVMRSISNVSISEWSAYYTSGPHLGGKNQSQAEWTLDKWASYGIPSSIVPYNVLLNYPVSHTLSLSYPDGSHYTASLEEDVLPEDPTSGSPERIPTFHGYSFTGNATAEYVYVGRGRKADFERLVALNVSLSGKIALAKYGGPFRGLKVRNAQDHGMIGTLIYSDPGDDGHMTEENGYEAYPNGPARNPSSVQRGSVMFLSTYPGDPTTPGYPSKPGVPRQDTSSVIPHIPSLPLSYRDALPLLKALNGEGVSAHDVNITDWTGGLSGVEYSTGPAKGAVLSMENVMDDKITDIWNTIGVINGTINDEVVVIGNHRDAWITGGASDPNSGSAVIVEIARAFGKLVEKGWKPRRTIVFASWDAEEYGLVGSTEWFEEFVTWAVPNVVAYLNVDVAVSGPNWVIKGVPELHDILTEVMKKIPLGDDDSTIYDNWTKNNTQERYVGVLGSGSDYTVFVHSGIASIDMGFGPTADSPVYHYHSNYDSYHWMSTLVDPTFSHHVAAAQFLGVLALNLAEQPLIPMNVSSYTDSLRYYYSELNKAVVASGLELDLGPLAHAIHGFGEAARKLMEFKGRIKRDGWEARAVNQRVKMFERGFVSQGGLPGREFYKHLIYAPGLDTGYAPATFPGITEAVMGGDLETAKEFVRKTARAVWTAVGILAVGRWCPHGDHDEVQMWEELRFDEGVMGGLQCS